MTDIINRLIKRRYITADEAALAIAGIDPAWVNDSVQSAIDGNYIGWEMARDVKKSIVEAVCDGDISANRIFNKTTKDGRFSHQLKRSLSGRILNPEHINSIELKAIELWPWLHRIGWLNEPIESPYSKGNGFIDPKSAELPRTPGIERIIRAMDADKEYGAQVAELKSLLEQANKELAHLKSEQEKADRAEVLHNTRLMKIAIETQRTYWGENWVPGDFDTAPRKTVIVDRLISEYGLSNAQAQAVEAVACPIDRNPTKSP